MNKESILSGIILHLTKKMETIRSQIQDLSISNDVKSSAGDKHETAKSLAQLEQEKLGIILHDLESNLLLMKKISSDWQDNVRIGSLILMDGDYYFIGVAAGSVQIEGITIFCMSTNAPLAKQCLGKKKGENFQWQGKNKTISEIY